MMEVEETGPYNESGCKRLNLAILIQAILDYRYNKNAELKAWLLTDGFALLTANSNATVPPAQWAAMVNEGFQLERVVYKH
jgi:hypothetical protein